MPDQIQTTPPVVPLLTGEAVTLEVMSYGDCCDLLRNDEVGRTAFVTGGAIVILPVNYAFVAESVVFRTAPGSKLAHADNGAAMSFEIDGWDPAARTGWSVLVKGTSEHVTNEWLTSMFEYLGAEPWANDVPRENWVRIRSTEITGRRITHNE